MVKSGRILKKFEQVFVRRKQTDISANFRLLEGMYREARILGVFPSKDPLEGIEADIRIARVVNRVSETP